MKRKREEQKEGKEEENIEKKKKESMVKQRKGLLSSPGAPRVC